jgi:2-polyprenyl-6-methoxyphenol hydroxylase-like FAD-dependent oxidoreductase
VHAIPPALAQGVNQVLEDVWVLCGQFGPETVGGDPATVAAALATYEQTCRRRLRYLDRYAGMAAGRVQGTSTSLCRAVADRSQAAATSASGTSS